MSRKHLPDVLQIADAARQPVDARHHQHVAVAKETRVGVVRRL
jgi:hypothetical protein